MNDSFNKLTVQSIMTPVPLETADSSDNIYNICQTMTQKNVGCIIIIEDKVPVGIITERDIVRKVVYENKDVKNTKTSEIMSHPLITVSPEFYLDQTARIMTKYRIRRIPVVMDKILYGIVTAGDLGKKMCERGSQDPVLMAMSRYSLIEKL